MIPLKSSVTNQNKGTVQSDWEKLPKQTLKWEAVVYTAGRYEGPFRPRGLNNAKIFMY